MAATILTEFRDTKLSEAVDRVLRIVCEEEARKILAVSDLFLTRERCTELFGEGT